LAVERSQKTLVRPPSHLAALMTGSLVCEAPMDTLVDTHINDILSGVRKALVLADLLVGEWVIGGHGEPHPVGFEEERQHFGHGTGHIVCAGRVIRIVRRIDQRLPVRIADRPWISVFITFPNGGDGPPENVMSLGVPRRDDR